jgi:hypothetical protein
MIPGKPAEGVDDDDIEGRAARSSHVEQALQFRSAVVRAAHAGRDEFYSDIPAAGGTVGERLPPLVGDRQVRLGLPTCRDTKVESRAFRRLGLFRVEGGRHGVVFCFRFPQAAIHCGACESV